VPIRRANSFAFRIALRTLRGSYPGWSADALLGKKQNAISEARHAVEVRAASKDALAAPGTRVNLALVYAWTNELDLAFETWGPLATIPNSIYYGGVEARSTMGSSSERSALR
jgi:hypothetical protein